MEGQREYVLLDNSKADSNPESGGSFFPFLSLSFILFIFTAVFEGLHKYGFRNGLCNSLYSPSFNVDKLTESDVSAIVLMMTITNLILVDGVYE